MITKSFWQKKKKKTHNTPHKTYGEKNRKRNSDTNTYKALLEKIPAIFITGEAYCVREKRAQKTEQRRRHMVVRTDVHERREKVLKILDDPEPPA